VPDPCPCDPYDIVCLEDHIGCNDANSIPVISNLYLLVLSMFSYGAYKLWKFKREKVYKAIECKNTVS